MTRMAGFFGNSAEGHRDGCSMIVKIVSMSMYIYLVFPDPVADRAMALSAHLSERCPSMLVFALGQRQSQLQK